MSWRRLLTLMRRESQATLRDPFTLSILVLVPLAALLIFGFVLSTEVHDLVVGVRDDSQTTASRRLLSDIEAGGDFRLVPFATRQDITRAFRRGEISAALIIPSGFDRRLREAPGGAAGEVQVLYDGGETILAGNADAFLRSIVNTSVAQIAARTAGGAPPPPPGIEVRIDALYNPKLDGTPYMVAGTFGFVLTFLTTLITAVSVITERLGGTFEQLQVTPATSLEIFLGKVLPLGGVFAFDVVLMVIAAGLILGVWPHGSVLFFVLVSSFYVLTSLALGVFISATSSTAAEAVQKTVLTSIPLIQLSGFAFPIRNMPIGVQWLTEIFPATHYIRVSRAIYLRGAGVLDVLPELLMLGIFGALLMRVALRSIEARA
ncbi:MAG: ABC transporter permease [Deltaproteobacteria bacterium]|nr:ABC transporter permease [Deltaproteobacteria bacterium]